MTTPTGPVYQSWTNSKWEQWFRDGVASTQKWKDFERTLDSLHEDSDTRNPVLQEGSLARDPATRPPIRSSELPSMPSSEAT